MKKYINALAKSYHFEISKLRNGIPLDKKDESCKLQEIVANAKAEQVVTDLIALYDSIYKTDSTTAKIIKKTVCDNIGMKAFAHYLSKHEKLITA